MKVILRTDIPNIGKQGDVKDVATGYARNYLLPRQLVWESNEQSKKLWEQEKVKLSKQKAVIVAGAKGQAEQIEKLSITIPVKVGDSGKLFGSVTNAAIAAALGEKGFAVDKHDVLLEEPIKEVGIYSIDVRIHPEVTAKAKVWVVEEKSEETAEGTPSQE
jgi:large subunit ribosomal protein L9